MSGFYESDNYHLWCAAADEWNLRMAESQAEAYFDEQAEQLRRLEDMEYSYFDQFAGDERIYDMSNVPF